MNKRWKILTAALVTGLLIVAFTGVIFATGPVTPNADCPNAGDRLGGGGHGMGGYFGQGALCDEAVSDLLGLSAEEIQAQRLEGKSLVEIAAAVDVSENALVTAIMAAKTDTVQELVAAGTITQEQADLMIQKMEQQTTLAVNRTDTGPFGQGGQGMGHGGMHRWAQTD